MAGWQPRAGQPSSAHRALLDAAAINNGLRAKLRPSSHAPWRHVLYAHARREQNEKRAHAEKVATASVKAEILREHHDVLAARRRSRRPCRRVRRRHLRRRRLVGGHRRLGRRLLRCGQRCAGGSGLREGWGELAVVQHVAADCGGSRDRCLRIARRGRTSLDGGQARRQQRQNLQPATDDGGLRHAAARLGSDAGRQLADGDRAVRLLRDSLSNGEQCVLSQTRDQLSATRRIQASAECWLCRVRPGGVGATLLGGPEAPFGELGQRPEGALPQGRAL
mmetsp:Transcript_27429/g.88639  ORF Transcript_27429/g.88639 Transcript_27429/m.88639 type:complete len:279 (+) Transcript_27429:46-882(+)